MKLVLVAALVTALAFAGSRFSFLRLPLARLSHPLGVRNLLLTGTEFLLVGLLLGDAALGVLDDATLRGLAPILGLGLAWIGMLFGSQWEIRRLRSHAGVGLTAALTQAVVVVAVVGAPLYLLLRGQFAVPDQVVLLGALTLGAAASDTAPSALALSSRGLRGAGRSLAGLLRLTADVDGLVAVAVFGAVCWLPVLHDGVGSVWLWAALSVGLGIVVGVVVVALSAYQLDEDEELLVLLGAVLFGGGLALYLSLSPLFVNAVAGAVVANLAGERALRTVRTVLVRADRAIYVLFLIVAGAQWHPGWAVAGLALAYLVLRSAGKLLGGWLAFRRHVEPPVARRLGLGLLSHGGLAVAIVVNLQQIEPHSTFADAVTTVVLVGVFVSELVSPSLVRRLLRSVDGRDR